MEALLRSNSGPQADGSYYYHIVGPLASINRVLDLNQASQVQPSYLSLVATMRKIMYPVTRGGFSGSGPEIALTTDKVSDLTIRHIEIINTIGRMLDKTDLLSRRCNNTYSSSGMITPSLSPLSCSGHVLQDTSNVWVAPDIRMVARHRGLYHNVQAVMLAVVVQLCHYRVELSIPDKKVLEKELPAWMMDILELLDVPSSGLQILFKDRIMRLHSHPSIAQQEVGPCWEVYAREHFEGRLLPGCCHLGCKDLTGVAEENLLTLLCSGCRRACYCGVKCQRGAWLEGHSVVCNKH